MPSTSRPSAGWIRWIRSEEELNWFRTSARLTDLACEYLAERIRPGLSEHDLVAIIHEACVPHGGNPTLHFLTTTPMDHPERCLPWQYPTDRKLAAGDMVTTEITVSYWTYGSQTHRPYAVGKKPNDTYRRLFDAALECFERVRAVLKPGCTSEEVVAASAIIEESGFTAYDSLLHGEAARNPELGTRSSHHPLEPWTFQEHMVVVIQPNPVTPDFKAGLQLGSAVVINSGEAEILQKYPFRFTVCA